MINEDGLVVSDDPTRLDVAAVHRWLSEESYWAAGRDEDTVRRSLAGSRCYGVYGADGRQVAFTRVVTDGVTFAWICDVFVDSAERGRGIGRWLVAAVIGDLQAAGVNRLLLATADAHEVYRRVGFEALAGPDRFMEIDTRPTRAAILAAATRPGARPTT
ncbi:GNAT family N-acetyltransferase [Longispora sp. K20-0274]|uniref:GNAT family N-acetyltransferase n=1 Tax=Longispora sp. K20-0274 TaxID=3088255 RepID=UPI00399B2510